MINRTFFGYVIDINPAMLPVEQSAHSSHGTLFMLELAEPELGQRPLAIDGRRVLDPESFAHYEG
jgi:hypothetical protein